MHKQRPQYCCMYWDVRAVLAVYLPLRRQVMNTYQALDQRILNCDILPTRRQQRMCQLDERQKLLPTRIDRTQTNCVQLCDDTNEICAYTHAQLAYLSQHQC